MAQERRKQESNDQKLESKFDGESNPLKKGRRSSEKQENKISAGRSARPPKGRHLSKKQESKKFFVRFAPQNAKKVVHLFRKARKQDFVRAA